MLWGPLCLGRMALALLTVEEFLGFGRRDAAYCPEEAAVVEPVNPFQGAVYSSCQWWRP